MNFAYNRAAYEIMRGALDLSTAVLKVMPVTAAYVPDRDDDFVAAASGAEIVATNYAGGFGGAGRLTLVNPSFTEDDVNDRAELRFDNPTWNALGGAVNDTIRAFVVIVEMTNDADSLLVLYIDTSTGTPSLPYLTTGATLTVQIPVEGLLQFSTVTV